MKKSTKRRSGGKQTGSGRSGLIPNADVGIGKGVFHGVEHPGLQPGLDKGWIVLASGETFWPTIPAGPVLVSDIAAALSKICRFTGHTSAFYSVAQHSCYVARLVKCKVYCPKAALQALVHDASEAYLADIARPVKQTKGFERYCILESRLMGHIWRELEIDIDKDDQEAVLEADQKIVTNEAMWFMPTIPEGWEIRPGYTDAELRAAGLPAGADPWLPQVAEHRFLDLYYELEKEIEDGRGKSVS